MKTTLVTTMRIIKRQGGGFLKAKLKHDFLRQQIYQVQKITVNEENISMWLVFLYPHKVQAGILRAVSSE